MKTNVVLLKKNDDSEDALQPEYAALQQYILNIAATFMRICGVNEIQLDPYLSGIMIFYNPQIKYNDAITPPEALQVARPFIIKWIVDIMPLVNFMSIQLDPTEEDNKETEQLWEKMKTGALGNAEKNNPNE